MALVSHDQWTVGCLARLHSVMGLVRVLRVEPAGVCEHYARQMVHGKGTTPSRRAPLPSARVTPSLLPYCYVAFFVLQSPRDGAKFDGLLA
jgi:hypothetical protein